MLECAPTPILGKRWAGRCYLLEVGQVLHELLVLDGVHVSVLHLGRQRHRSACAGELPSELRLRRRTWHATDCTPLGGGNVLEARRRVGGGVAAGMSENSPGWYSSAGAEVG